MEHLEINPILYVAFPVEDDFADKLLNCWVKIPIEHKPAVAEKSQARQRLHLTVGYLGEVRGKNVEVAIEGIEHRIQEMPKREFVFRRFKIFPTPRENYLVAGADVPEIELWLAFIRKLRKSFQHTLAPSFDDRPWSPHVSIGRDLDGNDRGWTARIPEFRWKPKNLAVYAKTTRHEPGRIIRTFALT